MPRKGRAIGVFLAALALSVLGCSLFPDYWSPKTYPLEVRPYLKDTGALGPSWKKYELKGEEGRSFFFAREDLWAVITVSFTCGKYQDVPLPLLAEHLIFPMGRKAEILREGYLRGQGVDAYHLVARGDYCYQKEAVYKDLGPVPRESAEMMVDAYVIGEPHCVVDLVYAASPEDYPRGLPDFHAYLKSLGVPVEAGE